LINRAQSTVAPTLEAVQAAVNDFASNYDAASSADSDTADTKTKRAPGDGSDLDLNYASLLNGNALEPAVWCLCSVS
jgi:hypothetical protein